MKKVLSVVLMLACAFAICVTQNQAEAYYDCTHPHTWEFLSDWKGADCTTDGYNEYTTECTDCYEDLSTRREIIKATGHTPDEEYLWDEEEATCTEAGYQIYRTYCKECYDKISERKVVLPAMGHKGEEELWDYDNPTCYSSGTKVYRTYCDGCWELLKERKVTVPAVDHVYAPNPIYYWAENGSKMTCYAVFNCEYWCGKDITKQCTVTAMTKKTATYAAKGSVVYTASLKYNGKTYTTTKTVATNKKAVSKVTLFSVKNTKSKSMTVAWKANSSVTGYQIQCSTDKGFKNAKTVTVKSKKTTSATVSKLTKGKTYYVRIRGYVTESKKNYYSAWSGSKQVKISK